MVKLSIIPATVRTFPYTGYLGLTPLKLEGSVCVALAADGKPLLANSITLSVRCYETRLGRVSVLQSNILVDHTEELWSKPDGHDYAEVSELELPFRIVLPSDLGGRSTITFPDYRVFWRIEAIIHHIPITGVGCRQIKHYNLPWIRYDLPSLPPCPSIPSPVKFITTTAKLRAPTIRYSVETPHSPIGPLDLVSIVLRLLPLEAQVTIRSASLIVERRIHYFDTSTPPSPRGPEIPTSPPSLPSPSSFTLCPTKATSSSLSRTTSRSPSPVSLPSSNKTSDATSPDFSNSAPTPSEPYLKTVAVAIVGVESSGRFAQDDTGVWTKTLTFQWPAARSTARWAIGETSRTEIVSVKFFARIKIIVSSPSGTESIVLSDQELIIVPTSAAERELAARKANVTKRASTTEQARLKSKSKSPRRRKRDRSHDPMPGPIASGSSPRGVSLDTPDRRMPLDPGCSLLSTAHAVSNAVECSAPVYCNLAGSYTPDIIPGAVEAPMSVNYSDSSPCEASTPYAISNTVNKSMSVDSTHSGSSTAGVVSNTAERPMRGDFTPSGSYMHGVVPTTVDKARRRTSDQSWRRKFASPCRRHTTCEPCDKTEILDRTACSRKRSADMANAESDRREQCFPHTKGIRRKCLVVPVGNSESIPDPFSSLQPGNEIPSVTATEDIRAWEEELVKIEVRSRRRSAEMKGFAHKTKCTGGDGPSTSILVT